MVRFIVVLTVLLGFSPAAHAQTQLTVPPPNWCIHEGESVWHDRRVELQALARITLDIECYQGEVARLRVKTETRCRPAYCSWSFAEDVFVDGGTIHALFLTFTARRSMRIELAGNWINVEVENDYHQTGRASDQMRASLPLRD